MYLLRFNSSNHRVREREDVNDVKVFEVRVNLRSPPESLSCIRMVCASGRRCTSDHLSDAMHGTVVHLLAPSRLRYSSCHVLSSSQIAAA